MKTIIFDLDGTLLDTLDDLANAVNYALETFNLPTRSKEYVRLAIGNGTTVLIKRCAPSNISDEDRQKVFDCFKEYYFKHFFDNTKPYTGVINLLKKLKEQKVYIAVVSNKDNDLTNYLIDKEFPGLFDVVQGSYLDKPKKPHPYLITKIMADLDVRENDCLYIGDTNVDKQSADNAFIKYLLVNYGYRTKDELKEMCPEDTSISTIDELYKEIIKWVNL